MMEIASLTEEQKTKILKEVFEYANQDYSYLSSYGEYAKGYKDGVGVVKNNVQKIFADYDILA